MAVKFDANNEPYLQLPPPHSQFRLTPTRETDAPVVIAAMNDPSVYMNFIATPCPYLQQDWNAWFPILSNVTCKAVAELREVEEWKRGGMVGERKWVGAGQPFPAIRETDPETGEERFLGEVAIRRATFRQVKDEAEKKEMEERNLARKAGDPEIEWEMGFWLAPSAQGRGVMTVVLRALLNTFFVGYMNVQRLRGGYLEHNVGSKRVLEKCGFVYERKLADFVEINEKKIGVKGKKANAVDMIWRP
ncbi:hypothetical protein GTA08_BOTSDO06173 [Botryosphaeria dothidea]|uniref:N-acetyltransferase domain-containing protein n=1 Tax=Botryosphaeria dothidea TaxID=55169 RepID=A0A8H4IIX9_9PEZI|nr:hypothetical protein GTA08_BOTSDO10325 [Botryosphaeria dothidea]KAF4305570.1 hypothetical protein GTA08_BOTSDO06173 [Botryosphaeria dothidea]